MCGLEERERRGGRVPVVCDADDCFVAFVADECDLVFDF